MSCNCNNNETTTQHICAPKPCTNPPDCSCPTILKTDCSIYSGEDLECSGIVKGTILTELIQQLDAFICKVREDLINAFTLRNIGTGAEVYKGVDLLGRKEIRKINATGDLVTVTQNTNDISVSINEANLDTFIEANQKTYTVANVGSDPLRVNVYKDSTPVGNNTQFNFRSVVKEDLGNGESFLKDIQENTNELNVRVKTLVSDNLTITSTDDEVRIETPMTASIPALYVNDLYVPSYPEWLAENSFQNGGTPLVGFVFKGRGTLSAPFCDDIVYPLAGGSPTTTPNTAIQNALDGDSAYAFPYSYVGSTALFYSRLNPQRSGQQIIIQNNNSFYTFTGNFGYSNLNLKIEGTVVSTTTGYILDADNASHFNNADSATITLEADAILQTQGIGFNNSGSTVATSNFTDTKTISLFGEGRVEALLNIDPLTRYIINSDITETGNKNDAGLTFDIRCFISASYQGIYNIKGNSRVDFSTALLQSGDIANTVNIALKAFNQEGGTVRKTEATSINILGNTRIDGITFSPNVLYNTSYSNSGGIYEGLCTNLFNKLNTEDVSFTVVDTNSGTNLTISNAFESPNLWAIIFKNNNLATGSIDITKADLTLGNNISAINTIGNNVIEILRQFDDRADAIANSMPLYSAYIKTNGNAYPSTATWVRDIVLPV